MSETMELEVMDGPGGKAVVDRDERMPAPTMPAPTTPMELAQQAIAAGRFDVVDKLMDYQDRYDAKMARRAFDAAISAAKARIPVIMKNRAVDFTSQKGRTNYRYEDLAEIARTVDPILGEHGLSYRFRPSALPGEPVTVTCILSHRDGHFEESSLSAGRDESGNKNAIQAIGSTLTYLQRMTLKAALGLAASDDDDGKGAGNIDEPEYITAEQVKAIEDRCAAEGVNVDKLCLHLKVTAIENVLAKDHDTLIRVLNQRRAAKEMKAKEGAAA